MAKLACVTDICPAESGGSHGRSSKRCVVGSPDFWAERSSVGSQVENWLRLQIRLHYLMQYLNTLTEFLLKLSHERCKVAGLYKPKKDWLMGQEW
jgi:hypothetical protein